jgi:hypothetical protein
MNNTRYLSSPTLEALLEDLSANGYEWKNEDGSLRTPQPFEQTINHRGHAAIYLAHVPIGEDEEGVTLFSEDFCANTTKDPEGVFATEIEVSTPYNTFG